MRESDFGWEFELVTYKRSLAQLSRFCLTVSVADHSAQAHASLV